MIVRQEENTPVGDYFHDSGVLQTFNSLEESVDEFEIDTEEIMAQCDLIIEAIKGLKAFTKKVEASYSKYIQQQKIIGEHKINF
jgi:hypothetical protein